MKNKKKILKDSSEKQDEIENDLSQMSKRANNRVIYLPPWSFLSLLEGWIHQQRFSLVFFFSRRLRSGKKNSFMALLSVWH